MFVDTLPSPYYDMLVVNAFVKFGNLMYSVGRIENGIRRGKITDIRASMMEKKRISSDRRVKIVFGGKREQKKITYDTGRACQESSSFTMVCPSPLGRFSFTPKARTGI